MKRRVVITGMGAVSPNGVGNAAFADGILAGRSGVRRISRFDPTEIPVQIAGEVADFDELAWVEKRERKHVSRVLPLALAAATEALGDAGLDPASLPLEHKRRFGVILGSGGGSQFPEQKGVHQPAEAQEPDLQPSGSAQDGFFLRGPHNRLE